VVDVFLASYPFASRDAERVPSRLGSFAGVLELN
jgi:hypothetical protein